MSVLVDPGWFAEALGIGYDLLLPYGRNLFEERHNYTI